MNAVDTNIYVYALDADEPAKQTKTAAEVEAAFYRSYAMFPIRTPTEAIFRSAQAIQPVALG